MKSNLPKSNSGESQLVIRLTDREASPDSPKLGLVDRSSDTCLQDLKQSIVARQHELTALIGGRLLKAIELGELLIRLRKELPHGSFLPWIDQELEPACGVKRRTAQRYMHLARHRGLVESKLRESEPSLELLGANASVHQILSRLRIKDGERILEGVVGAPSSVQDNPSIPEHISVAIQNLLAQFRGDSKLPQSVLRIQLPRPAISAPERFCLYHVESFRQNDKAATQVSNLLKSHETECFLWISGHRLEQWGTLLTAFPRVCVRDMPDDDSFLRPCWWLFGLLKPNRFSDFANAICHLGDVLVPFQNHARSSKRDPNA